MAEQHKIFIGWDVGGWNCDYNPKSRDALVILDEDRTLLGVPWRGNLRTTINQSTSTEDFIRNLLVLCRVDKLELDTLKTTLAIDTPLGFSRPLIDLLISGQTAPSIGLASENPYLHRQTEHFLFKMGLSPLSPIKDMIGSQATKGMHVLRRFAPAQQTCGVWTDGRWLQAIEAYPSACKRSRCIDQLRAPFFEQVSAADPSSRQFISALGHVDLQDALTCALLGWLFEYDPESLAQPLPDIDPVEGWIFVPADGLRRPAD
jgi:hypothetical protein